MERTFIQIDHVLSEIYIYVCMCVYSFQLNHTDYIFFYNTTKLDIKYQRQEEKGMTEDEMVGWHHQLYRHEFEQAPGIGDGQGSLACCNP